MKEKAEVNWGINWEVELQVNSKEEKINLRKELLKQSNSNLTKPRMEQHISKHQDTDFTMPYSSHYHRNIGDSFATEC
jgi:hypothetical protein